MSPSPKRKTRLCLLLVLSLLSVTTGARAEQLPIKSYTSADGLAGEYIDCIVHDSHGFLWFCTLEGLSRFDGYNFVNYGLEQGLPTGEALNLLERRDGSYWVGTTNGVCHFNLFAARTRQAQLGSDPTPPHSESSRLLPVRLRRVVPIYMPLLRHLRGCLSLNRCRLDNQYNAVPLS